MTEEVFDNVGQMFCGNCKYFGHKEPCTKRIDHQTVKFAKPWFKSYDCNQFSGCICSDFEPAEWCVYAHSVWTNFQEYWEWYSKECVPYGNTDVLMYFTLRDNTSIRYGVPLMDFVNGTMYEGTTLKAVEKEYYKKHRVSEACATGFELIREKITGIEIGGKREMPGKIHIEPDRVWDYFCENQVALRSAEELLAENPEYGVEIMLSEDNGLPLFTVFGDDMILQEENALDAEDCEEMAGHLYGLYLSGDVVSRLTEEESESAFTGMNEELDMIQERETELDDAIMELLNALGLEVMESVEDPDILVDEMKDHICEWMYHRYGISVYRPMYLEDENGEDEFCEYPYEQMEFDDD